jgi:curved DNA-binding protein CbpA
LFLRGKLRRVTDYFALFGQARRPSIELEKLEEKYHELARLAHPDQSAQPASHFAEINEGYRILRDPKSRLQHLLTLEGQPSSPSAAEVPAGLADLFMKIGRALARNDQDEIDAITKELNDHYAKALEQLQQLNTAWNKNAALNVIDDLYRRFAFLTRWKDLLEEHRFNISANRERTLPAC